MGRRWGKTVLGLVLVVTFAAAGGHVAWVVPEYKNGRPLWRSLRSTFAPLRRLGIVKINDTDRTIEFDEEHGGGFIGMYSGGDDADSVRSDAFHLIVLDEAAKLSEAAWTDSILPTLADHGGKAVLISTPRGRNWFWREWMRGQDDTQPQVRSFTAPSSDNPNPRIKRAAALARERVSERSYRQEWLAEFVDDAGGVFKGVRACIGGTLDDGPSHPQRRYAVGVDLAKLEDYTVCVVMDLHERRVAAFERFNLDAWPLQKQRIYALAKRWNDALVWLDSTGVGSPIYDDLARAGLRVQPYTFTNASKSELIENAVLLVEQRQVHFPPIAVLVDELEAYEYDRTPAGRVTMNAPGGMHDDCVIAFALACWPLKAAGSSLSAWGTDFLDQLARPASQINGVKLLRRGPI